MKSPQSVPFEVGGELPESRKGRTRGSEVVLPQVGWFVGVMMSHPNQWVRFDCGPDVSPGALSQRAHNLRKVDGVQSAIRNGSIWARYAP